MSERTFEVDTHGTTRIVYHRKRWTKERRAILVALALCGADRAAIAQQLGISRHAVSCEMSRIGTTIRHLNRTPIIL